MTGFFDGVRVLDLTNVLAGPFCGYQLALQGAEVIKVEVPEFGDLARQLGAETSLNASKMGASFLAQNAGKKSITLNLKHASGKKLFKKLVSTADVVLENFRPGVMDRLGFGYAALRELKSSLIYCAISGFGQTGPAKNNPAYDQIIQGMSGAMSVTGDKSTGPLRIGYPVCDTVGGMTAAFAIAGALFKRSITGEGEFLDVAMLDSSISTLGWVVSNWLTAGIKPEPMGNENFTASPSGTFKTGNGLLNISANEQNQFEALCHLIGQPELAGDARFALREARKQNRIELKGLIEAGLASRSAEEWEIACNSAGIPAGRILSVPETLEHPQIKHRQLMHSFDHVPGADRPVTVVRAGFKTQSADNADMAPPPQLGQDTDTLLVELGCTPAEIALLRKDGAI